MVNFWAGERGNGRESEKLEKVSTGGRGGEIVVGPQNTWGIFVNLYAQTVPAVWGAFWR